ncbi:hypothetical protein D3C79_1002540 [compost metagenome]
MRQTFFTGQSVYIANRHPQQLGALLGRNHFFLRQPLLAYQLFKLMKLFQN